MVSSDDDSLVSVEGKPESVTAITSDSGDDSVDDDPSAAADGKEPL